MATENISKITQQFIRQNPHIRDSLQLGLVNYSALARYIAEHNGLGANETTAIVAACKRFYQREKSRRRPDNPIRALVSRARILIRSKIAVITIRKPFPLATLSTFLSSNREGEDVFNLIECEHVYTVITNQSKLGAIQALCKTSIVRIEQNFIQLTMLFDESLESTPGVMAFIFSRLYDHEINIREEVSCWTDLMIVIEEKDLARTVEVLNFS